MKVEGDKDISSMDANISILPVIRTTTQPHTRAHTCTHDILLLAQKTVPPGVTIQLPAARHAEQQHCLRQSLEKYCISTLPVTIRTYDLVELPVVSAFGSVFFKFLNNFYNTWLHRLPSPPPFCHLREVIILAFKICTRTVTNAKAITIHYHRHSGDSLMIAFVYSSREC